MRRAPVAAVLAAVMLAAATLAVPAAAAPVEATAEEVRTLAGRAGRDPEALERLRGIARVDGAPVDLRAALAGPPDAAMRERLAALAAPPAPGRGPGPGQVEPAAARAEAGEILSDRRFRGVDLPQPLRRPLERLGEQMLAAAAWLADRLPGGSYTLWGLIALAVVLSAIGVASRLGRRRARGGPARPAATSGARAETPRQLERRAEEAEGVGELATALRLRFRAGLLRLHAAERISLRPSVTTGDVSRRLASPAFDELASVFEAVAYGGRRADPRDVEAARSGWEHVLRERGTA